MKQLVRAETEGHVRVLRLDNPPHNAYSHEMMREFDQAILDARFDEVVDVIVLRGEGDRFFCAGADVAMLREAEPRWKYQFCLHANETLLRLEHTPKLVIAGLNGHCVGGGLEVALACDLRVAKPGAGKVGLPEVALGVLPGTGGTQRLVRLLGKAKAIELMASGARFDVDEACRLGLVNRVLPGEDWDAALLAFAAGFARPNAASLAVGAIKRACQSGAETGLEQGLALERELQARLFETADAAEGLRAFTEKRPPSFQGK